MSDPMKKIPRRPVVLIILDGLGLNPAKAQDALVLARTPNMNMDRYFARHPHTAIQASGLLGPATV